MVVSFLSAAFSSFNVCNVAAAKTLGPCDERAVARDLIVLDGLAGRNDGCVQHILVLDLAADILGLIDGAVDRRAVDQRPASGTPARAAGRGLWSRRGVIAARS